MEKVFQVYTFKGAVVDEKDRFGYLEKLLTIGKSLEVFHRKHQNSHSIEA